MLSIVGTWRLVKTAAFDEHGAPLAPPYGPRAMGLAMFHPDGRMMAVLSDARVDLPPGERDYMSYCGRYTFDGATLRTRVDGSSEPTRVGGEQVRAATIENGLLKLAPPLRPWRGVLQRHELFWERIG